MTRPPRTPPDLLAQLEQYLEPFRAEFRRQDQLRRAAAYLLGLLQPGGRKNIEHLARTVRLPASWAVNDVAQALQHFVNQSPWDHDAVTRLYLKQQAAIAGADGLFVVAEQTFVKQGTHSVGVQRQYSSVLGQKVNCQVAIALHHVSPDGFLPLGTRLYLPRAWLQDRQRLASAGVPDELTATSKSAIALELIDRALANGLSACGVALGACTGLREDLAEGLASRGLAIVAPSPAELAEPLADGERRLQQELGLEQFEGRSWRGFHHHACLVLLAHGFQKPLAA